MTSLTTVSKGISADEEHTLITILNRLQDGNLSIGLFTALAKIFPIPTVETVILRTDNERIEILLIPRPENDIVWKGKLHSPGGVLRREDFEREDADALRGVFERIEKNEIFIKFERRPEFVGTILQKSQRGPEISQITLAQIPNNAVLAKGAGWYDIETLHTLPNFIQSQQKAIGIAVEAFKKSLCEKIS